MPVSPQLPRWVKPASRLIVLMQGLGIVFFSFYVLAIPGRRTGVMRETVVSPFTVAGRQYVLSIGQLDWVRNARAAGWGVLGRGRRKERVVLAEVQPPESVSIVGEFPRQIPAGVQFFVRTGLVERPGTPDQFKAAAGKLALFHLERVPGE